RGLNIRDFAAAYKAGTDAFFTALDAFDKRPEFEAQQVRMLLANEGGVLRIQRITDEQIARTTPSRAKLRETLLALRTTGPDALEKAKSSFYALAKLYDGQDHFYRAALNIACGTDPARRDAILADFDQHFPEWNDKVADLVWELRPKSVLPRLA